MFPMRDFMQRFGELLTELDALAADGEGETCEDLEDLNAELEDALMLLGEWRPEDDAEELADALEELRALAGDYRALSDRVPGLAELADRLRMAADMALGNLER